MKIKIEVTDDLGGIEVYAFYTETDSQLQVQEVIGRVVRMLKQALEELKSQRT